MVIANLLLGSVLLIGGGFALATTRGDGPSRTSRVAAAALLLAGWYFCLAAIEAVEPIFIATESAASDSVLPDVTRIPLPQMPPLR